MKNLLNYYYHFNIENMEENKMGICFSINDNSFVLMTYLGTIEEFKGIYNNYIALINNGISMHQIIPNINNEFLTNYENKNYVLLKVLNNYKDKISLNDVINFQNKTNNIKIKSNKIWNNLWGNKIDYFEYQMTQFGIEHPILRKTIDYFIGLAENGISAYNNFYIDNNLSICHKRIGENYNLFDLYNPFNIIFDVKSRDLAEFIKTYYLNHDNTIDFIINNLPKFNFDIYELEMLYIRMLFPSPYFDLLEIILEKNLDDNLIENVINNIENYEKILKDLFKYLSNFVFLPNIEWLQKSS